MKQLTDAERKARDRQRRLPEEIVLRKSTDASQRLIAQGRTQDAQTVLAAAVLIADVVAAESGRAPRPDAGLVWDAGSARYIVQEPARPLDAGGL